MRRGDLVPDRIRLDADVSEHDAAAFVHRWMEPVRRLQCAEGDGKVKGMERIELRAAIGFNPTREVAGDSHISFMHQFRKQNA